MGVPPKVNGGALILEPLATVIDLLNSEFSDSEFFRTPDFSFGRGPPPAPVVFKRIRLTPRGTIGLLALHLGGARRSRSGEILPPSFGLV